MPCCEPCWGSGLSVINIREHREYMSPRQHNTRKLSFAPRVLCQQANFLEIYFCEIRTFLMRERENRRMMGQVITRAAEDQLFSEVHLAGPSRLCAQIRLYPLSSWCSPRFSFITTLPVVFLSPSWFVTLFPPPPPRKARLRKSSISPQWPLWLVETVRLLIEKNGHHLRILIVDIPRPSLPSVIIQGAGHWSLKVKWRPSSWACLPSWAQQRREIMGEEMVVRGSAGWGKRTGLRLAQKWSEAPHREAQFSLPPLPTGLWPPTGAWQLQTQDTEDLFCLRAAVLSPEWPWMGGISQSDLQQKDKAVPSPKVIAWLRTFLLAGGWL